MDAEEIYDLVVDAVRQGMQEEAGGADVRLSDRMAEGRVIFEDGQGRLVKEVTVATLFKKVTAVREKLRVLEQKINNHRALGVKERAELQVHISRCYGSLTTFNFLFRDEEQRFRGTGG